MAFTPNICHLVLVFLLLVSMHIYGAQHIPGARCKCIGTIMHTSEKIVDFEITEKTHNCDKTEIIVTLEEDGIQRCLKPEGSLAKNLIRCWKMIQMNNNNKKRCLKKK